MRAMFPLVFLCLAAAVPSVAADHPGSNLGLARFLDPENGAPLAGDRFVHHNVDVDATFTGWEDSYPDYVERFTLGATSSGFQIYGALITDETVAYDAADLSTGHKMRIILDASHHGNEYLATELLMYFAEDLLAKASDNDEATLEFLRQVEIYLIPIVNVEGNTADTRKNGRLVDLNRNYPLEWGGPGSGASITDGTYRGPYPLSEPESKALADFGAQVLPDLWITGHTGVAEFYWPWGWTNDKSPDDVFFTSLEKPFEEATNGRVDAMQAAELYLAAGATDDFAYGTWGIPTFTYEVHEDQFIPVYGEPITGIVQDQLGGLDFMVRNVQKMGAWVEVTVQGDTMILDNIGWGAAKNITVRVGDSALTVDAIPAGGNATVPLPDIDATTVEVAYAPMLIETSRVRTHLVAFGLAPLESLPPEMPWAGVELLGMAFVFAVLLMRRRAT